jgi:hypothetical protein
MNLLSESALWKTESEFVTPQGIIIPSKGETEIEIKGKVIINNSWTMFDNNKRVNNYKICKLNESEYGFKSLNPELGIQTGKFNIDRNTIYSRFYIKETNFNGFEVIIRNNNECSATGILYDDEEVINSWKAIMKK